MNLLQKINARRGDVIPPDWKTVVQWAEEWDCHREHARFTLRDGLKMGLVERAIFKAPLTDGKMMPTAFYREVKKPAEKRAKRGQAFVKS